MRYQVSGRAPSIITAALAALLALGMQAAAVDHAKSASHDTQIGQSVAA